MRKRLTVLGAAILAVALTTAPSAGQQASPNPVMPHYRAYQAALAARDLEAAETAAAAALAASEARDGDGGRTAVLALNLATVRSLRDRFAEAIEPARRASALSRNAGSGVEPVMADLILGRVALALNEPGAADQLVAALRRAATTRVASEEIFIAASALGAWAMSNRNFDYAREAWSIAASFPEGSSFDPAFARAKAQINLGAAIFSQEIGRGGFRSVDRESAMEAHTAFMQAKEALRPLADVELADGGETLAQRAYTEAITWDAALRAKVRSDGGRMSFDQGEAEGDADNIVELRPPAVDTRPRCLVKLSQRNVRNLYQLYPSQALERGQIGAIGVRFRLNEAGEVEDAQLAAQIGSQSFARVVDQLHDWRFERHEDSPPNCRMAMNAILPIAFIIGGGY